jgi:hypothetical protein
MKTTIKLPQSREKIYLEYKENTEELFVSLFVQDKCVELELSKESRGRVSKFLDDIPKAIEVKKKCNVLPEGHVMTYLNMDIITDKIRITNTSKPLVLKIEFEDDINKVVAEITTKDLKRFHTELSTMYKSIGQ